MKIDSLGRDDWRWATSHHAKVKFAYKPLGNIYLWLTIPTSMDLMQTLPKHVETKRFIHFNYNVNWNDYVQPKYSKTR